jgi:hypothetical protein
MTDIAFDVDTAWEAGTKAHQRGDAHGEAIALTVLGQALVEEERFQEAEHFHQQASTIATNILIAQAELLVRRGLELEAIGGDEAAWDNGLRDQDPWSSEILQREDALSNAAKAFEQAGKIFNMAGAQSRSETITLYSEEVRVRPRSAIFRESIGWRPSQTRGAIRPPGLEPPPSADKVVSNPEPVDSTPPPPSEDDDSHDVRAYPSPPVTFEELAVGFLAVKLAGPFLEAFAAQLGQRLGESTAKALGRIRLRRHRSSSSDLEIDVPTSSPTVLVLPEDLTEEARLALVDLDPTADGVRGTTMHWNPDTGAWEQVEAVQE